MTIVAADWREYSLEDLGDGKKLERWGDVLLVRPETQAIWPHGPWPQPHAVFESRGRREGSWRIKQAIGEPWLVHYPLTDGPRLTFALELMPYRHTGVFPEQAANWQYLYEQVNRLKEAGKKPLLLNLFAYTGGATLALAAGEPREIVHVDAARAMLTRARQNQRLSGLEKIRVRYLADDVLAFVARESRRGRRYDGIVLDPPAFGYGPAGQRWKLEEGLFDLLRNLARLLNEGPAFLLLNTYSAGVLPATAETAVRLALAGMGGTIETVELELRARLQPARLALGTATRWQRR